MEIGPDLPVWVTWLAALTAAGAATVGIAAVARIVDAVFDLDPS